MIQSIKRIEGLTAKDIQRVFKGAIVNRSSRCLDIVPILFASLMEEIGEFCQAVKVEEQVVLHKQLTEPSYVEAIDIYVCGWLVYFALDGKLEEVEIISALDEEKRFSEQENQLKSNPSVLWQEMMGLYKAAGVASMRINQYGTAENDKIDVAKHIAVNSILKVITIASTLYTFRKGSLEDFETIMSAKLDKWEKNQGEREKQ